MKPTLVRVALVLSLAPAAWADAPETGIVAGRVKGPAGTPIPGVVVTLAGDRGDRTAVTDLEGAFRFALLVPGDYVVGASLDGFSDTQARVRVIAGGRHDRDLKLVALVEERITVVADAPLVDEFSVTAGATVSAELGVQAAPTTRTYYGLINALPGVTADAENDDLQQTRPSVNGSHFADQAAFVDGVDTTFAKVGGSRVFLPTTALTEVSMEAGGSSAEYGRSVGSVTNIIVKSGTNRFRSEVLIQHQEVDLGGRLSEPTRSSRARVASLPSRLVQASSGRRAGREHGLRAGFRRADSARPGLVLRGSQQLR